MAYNGYLLKIGNYKVPEKLIKADTYKAYINMQDLDPWTDADGYLHRNALELKAEKVEFETVPQLTNKSFAAFMGNIRKNFTNATAREAYIEAYIPELDEYVKQKGYMADIQPQMYSANSKIIKYDAIRFSFVGGVADD